MIEMANRILRNTPIDARAQTVAALCFWKITQYSKLYRDCFDMNDYCKSYEKLLAENIKYKYIYSCFDVTCDTIKKLYNNSIKDKFYSLILPNWEGRVEMSTKR